MLSGPNARVAQVDRENKLFVGMLPHDANDMTLTGVFSRFGEITEVCTYARKDVPICTCIYIFVFIDLLLYTVYCTSIL